MRDFSYLTKVSCCGWFNYNSLSVVVTRLLRLIRYNILAFFVAGGKKFSPERVLLMSSMSW